MYPGVGNWRVCLKNSNICRRPRVDDLFARYDVTIRNQNIDMQSLGAPRLVALANNTAVNHTWDPKMQG